MYQLEMNSPKLHSNWLCFLIMSLLQREVFLMDEDYTCLQVKEQVFQSVVRDCASLIKQQLQILLQGPLFHQLCVGSEVSSTRHSFPLVSPHLSPIRKLLVGEVCVSLEHCYSNLSIKVTVVVHNHLRWVRGCLIPSSDNLHEHESQSSGRRLLDKFQFWDLRDPVSEVSGIFSNRDICFLSLELQPRATTRACSVWRVC